MTKPSISQCRTCGKPFQSSKPGGYCGMACYRIAQRAGAYAGIRPIKASRIHKCANCGADRIGVDIKKRRNGEPCDKVFCSRACYDEFRVKVAAQRTRQCDHCGKDYIKPGNVGNSGTRFCSAECRDAGMKAKPRRCVCCGAWMTPVKYVKGRKGFDSNVTGKVCSRECLHKWWKIDPDRKAKISAAFRGAKHPNWQGGKLFLNHRSTWDRLADSIRDRDGHKCKSCGKPESENRRRLDVHHIVPRRECLSPEIANHPDNLISLCSECHMRIEWDGGQKRGTRRKGKLCKKAA